MSQKENKGAKKPKSLTFNQIIQRGLIILAVLILICLLIWRAVDRPSFVAAADRLWDDVWALTGQILTLVFMALGIAIIFGYRPFKSKH